MTEYDPLYPLVDDLGRDEKTLYVNGPRRSLRPITRLILSNWEGWPQFRENWKQTNQMRYRSIGMQHLLLPDPQRYLSDRFVSPNVGVPPTDQIVRVSSAGLLDALNSAFPLDTFQISLIPQAIRRYVRKVEKANLSCFSSDVDVNEWTCFVAFLLWFCCCYWWWCHRCCHYWRTRLPVVFCTTFTRPMILVFPTMRCGWARERLNDPARIPRTSHHKHQKCRVPSCVPNDCTMTKVRYVS